MQDQKAIRQCYKAKQIFDGEKLYENCYLNIEDGIIKDITDNKQKNVQQNDQIIEDFQNFIIVPGFIDIQIYGSQDNLFADYPDETTILQTQDRCINGGALYFMICVATNNKEIIEQSIQTVQNFQAKYQKNTGLLGLNLEGPFINRIKKGAHLEQHIQAPSESSITNLIEKGKKSIKIMTIAPELFQKEHFQILKQYPNLKLAAGHTDANFQQSKSGFENGVQIITHLYNCMPTFTHKEPGLIGAAFNDDKVLINIIVDGVHVHYEAVKVAFKQSQGRLFCITDAISTGKGQYTHRLSKNGEYYELENGTLSGSAVTMLQSFKNLIFKCGISVQNALEMVSVIPGSLIDDRKIGKLKEGYEGSFLVLNDDFELVASIQAYNKNN